MTKKVSTIQNNQSDPRGLNYALNYTYERTPHVGETRIGTKHRAVGNIDHGQERVRQYYYHRDHLGSAQLVTNYEGEIIHADLSDIKDLDQANRQLSALQAEGYKVVASDKDGNEILFRSFGGLTKFLEEIDPAKLQGTLFIGIEADLIGFRGGMSVSSQRSWTLSPRKVINWFKSWRK